MREPELDELAEVETDAGMVVRAAFDYAKLKPAVAREVRERAQWIRNLSRTVADGIRHMGCHLHAVRQMLPDGFCAWVDLEFAFGRATAYKMINVWEAFKDADLTRFDATALYILSEPRVSEETRKLALLTAKGSRVTAAIAKEIAAAERVKTPTKKEVRAHFKLNPEEKHPDDLGQHADDLQGMSAEDRQSYLDRPKHNLVRDHRLVLSVLRAVIAGADSVWIQRVVDLDADDEKVKAAAPAEGKHGKGREEEQSLAVPVLLTVYRDGRAETFGSAECVEIMILRAGGVRPTQRCAGCGQEKELLVHFGKKANKNNGRTLKCKACEARRVKGAKKEGQKRRERRAAERSLDFTEVEAAGPATAV
jgi:hypothetical protein